MANTKSAEKAARQAVKHRARNISLRSRSRSAIRDAAEAIAKGDKAAAPAAVRKASSSVDATAFVAGPVPAGLLRAGTNFLAVELHQSAADSSDASFDLSLTAESTTNVVSAQLV